MDLLSWNVAGIRARISKNHLDALQELDKDIVCLQETKATPDQVNLPVWLTETYPFRFWASCDGSIQRRGLNGVCIFSKIEPVSIVEPMEFHCCEGRVLALEYEDYILVNVYTPNSQNRSSDRFTMRHTEWDVHFDEWIKKLNDVKPTIICGDFNVAITDFDVACPDKWRNLPGMYPEERVGFSKYLESHIDTFRFKNPEEQKFSYQSFRIKSPYILGWRIDYFLLHKALEERDIEADIHNDITGSDHYPITLKFLN